MHKQKESLIHAHILLTPMLHQRAEQIARRERRSLADVVRRALDVGLAALEGANEAAQRRQEDNVSGRGAEEDQRI